MASRLGKTECSGLHSSWKIQNFEPQKLQKKLFKMSSGSNRLFGFLSRHIFSICTYFGFIEMLVEVAKQQLKSQLSTFTYENNPNPRHECLGKSIGNAGSTIFEIFIILFLNSWKGSLPYAIKQRIHPNDHESAHLPTLTALLPSSVSCSCSGDM